MSYTYQFELGVLEEVMKNVEDPEALNSPPYPWTWLDGAERYIAGTGKPYYDGYPQVVWEFTYLTNAAWEWLMGFFTNEEYCEVWLRTKDNTDTYVLCTGIMHRPVMGETCTRGVGGWFDVSIRFTHVEVQEEE